MLNIIFVCRGLKIRSLLLFEHNIDFTVCVMISHFGATKICLNQECPKFLQFRPTFTNLKSWLGA